MRLPACVLLLAACASETPAVDAVSPEDMVGQTDDEVVGGVLESRFPAIGYLMTGANGANLVGPNCGATLIADNVAVTAGHCIWGNTIRSFGVGLGQVGSGPAHPAKAVFMHPDYRRKAPSGRYKHDLALLVLADPVNGVTPMTRSATNAGAEALYVGYGRTSLGDSTVKTGYTNERKSAGQHVNKVDATNVWVNGEGGGLCWGDSGGPLMDPSSEEIFGVLADFDQDFTCKVGNKMIFTSLDAHSDFVDRVVACANADDPQGCMSGECKYTCAGYHYAISECHGGWRCDGACLQYIGNCD